MGLLDELTGGGQAQQQYQDFVGRYDQLSADDYQQAAQDSFATWRTMSGRRLVSSWPTRPRRFLG